MYSWKEVCAIAIFCILAISAFYVGFTDKPAQVQGESPVLKFDDQYYTISRYENDEVICYIGITRYGNAGGLSCKWKDQN